jgi:hypothetical protein
VASLAGDDGGDEVGLPYIAIVVVLLLLVVVVVVVSRVPTWRLA